MDSSSQFSVDAEVWTLAEQRVEEIICCVQPIRVADKKREQILIFLKNLISQKCCSEIFPFGSMPLRVYLPDGDIDITTLVPKSKEKDIANNLVSLLKSPRDDGISVCDVQYIRAQVEIVKCTINNIAVDISFNQLAGLSTLCFLEKVHQLIGKNHLFKRSVILIKTWCYYESRLLGAHNGLLSTYGLEVLVLYIINLFHSTVHGPLAVFHRFLEYYRKFDWENYAVSINGPVSISSLPGTVVPENLGSEKDQLLLSQEFLQTCRDKFIVSTEAADSVTKVFPARFLNIVDPLKDNNNLGRSVSKGSYYRMRCAFNFGLKTFREIFLHPGKRMTQRLEIYFLYTLDRNGKGQRPDVEVPVPAFGSGKFEVSDLKGDFDKYYDWLLHSQQYHKNLDALPQPSTPPSPFQVGDGIAMATPYQQMWQYQTAPYGQGSDVFVPRVSLCYPNSTILPEYPGYSEDLQRAGGMGAYFHGMLPYGETHSNMSYPSHDAEYLEEMQKSHRTGTYIPNVTPLMHRETHSNINHPFNDAGYSANMQKPQGMETYVPGMAQLKYRETRSRVNHHLNDAGISEKMQMSGGSGTNPSRIQQTYRENPGMNCPANDAGYLEHKQKSRGTGTYIPSMPRLSLRHAYIQMRSGTQSSYKEKHPGNHPSDREQYSKKNAAVDLSSDEFPLLHSAVKTSSTARQSSLPNVHQSKQISQSAGKTSSTAHQSSLPHVHQSKQISQNASKTSSTARQSSLPNVHPSKQFSQSAIKTSSTARQSSLPNLHQSKQSSAHPGTTEFRSVENALSSDLPSLLEDQLVISSATSTVDSSRSGPSSRSQKKSKGKSKAKAHNSSVPNASSSAADGSSGVSKKGPPNTMQRLELEAKPYYN